MKTPIYTHDFTQLEEILLSQFEPELLAETLEQSLFAIIQSGINNGEKAGTVIRKFDTTFTLMNVFKRMHLAQIADSAEILH